MNDITNQNPKLKIDKNISVSIILCTYLFIDILRFFNAISLIIGNGLYVLVGIISISYSVFKNGFRKQIPIFIFIYFYNFFGLVGILFNGNMDIQELLWPFAFIGLATLFLNFEINYKLARSIYYFVVFLLIVKITLLGGVDNLNTASSRNSIGIMVLIYFAIYSISSYKCGKEMTIFTVLFGFVVNVMAIGRSGILTFALLVVLFLSFRFDGERYKLRNPINTFIVVFIGLIVLWVSYKLLENYFLEMILNFQNRGLESTRIFIWSDYLTKTISSVKYLLFGTPINGTYWLDMFNNNLHNSFFMLHAKYGLFPFIITLILIIRSFFYFIKTKNVLYFIVLFAIMFRMQFDYTNFNDQLDIILFYLIFLTYMKDKCNVEKLKLKKEG